MSRMGLMDCDDRLEPDAWETAQTPEYLEQIARQRRIFEPQQKARIEQWFKDVIEVVDKYPQPCVEAFEKMRFYMIESFSYCGEDLKNRHAEVVAMLSGYYAECGRLAEEKRVAAARAAEKKNIEEAREQIQRLVQSGQLRKKADLYKLVSIRSKVAFFWYVRNVPQFKSLPD